MTLINGDGSVRLKVPALAAIGAGLGILAFLGGWISSHTVFSAELISVTHSLGELRAVNSQLNERMNIMTKADADDRLQMTSRLVNIEADVRYTKQDVSEIKLILVPKR